MRTLIVLSIVAIFATTAFTYEGTVDPVDLRGYFCQEVHDDYDIVLKQCRKGSKSILVWYSWGRIIRYAYLVNGVEHVFELNEDGEYIQIIPRPKVLI